MRFETDFFVPKQGEEKDDQENVAWRIADIDDYFASKLYAEFYRELPDEKEE